LARLHRIVPILEHLIQPSYRSLSADFPIRLSKAQSGQEKGHATTGHRKAACAHCGARPVPGASLSYAISLKQLLVLSVKPAPRRVKSFSIRPAKTGQAALPGDLFTRYDKTVAQAAPQISRKISK
jgi:hypothetical protein